MLKNHIKSENPAENPGPCTGQHIPDKMNTAQDPNQGQDSAQDHKIDSQPVVHPEEGHGDDINAENMPAGEAAANGILLDNRLKIIDLIGPLSADLLSDQADQQKRSCRNRKERKQQLPVIEINIDQKKRVCCKGDQGDQAVQKV